MSATVTPVTKAAIEAQLEALSEMGLEPIRTADLRGNTAVWCLDQPALLINTRANVSVLAGAALAMAQRAHSFLTVASSSTSGEEDLFCALESASSMVAEVVAMIDAVASHPAVMRAPASVEGGS